MEGMELTCFQIISAVGSARSYYIEAIKEARHGNMEKARELIEAGRVDFAKGHDYHLELLQKEADGKPVEIRMLLIHAEDQLMSAEDFGILAKEFVEMYEEMHGHEAE